MRVSMFRAAASWREHRNNALDVQLIRCIPLTRTEGSMETIWSQIYKDLHKFMKTFKVQWLIFLLSCIGHESFNVARRSSLAWASEQRSVRTTVQLHSFTRTEGSKKTIWSQIYEDLHKFMKTFTKLWRRQSTMISIPSFFCCPWEFQCSVLQLLGMNIVTTCWVYSCYVAFL